METVKIHVSCEHVPTCGHNGRRTMSSIAIDVAGASASHAGFAWARCDAEAKALNRLRSEVQCFCPVTIVTVEEGDK
jgi:hypothetical protein